MTVSAFSGHDGVKLAAEDEVVWGMGYLIQGAVVHTENQQTVWRNTIRLAGLPSSLGFTAIS